MARPPQDPKIRFDKFVVKMNGCHEFQSTIQKDGYGRFFYKGKQAQAHRVAYELSIGEIPEKMVICHKCDNRKCVNPEHLFLGTTKDNVLDMYKKNRQATPSRKISDEDVKQIFQMRTAGLSQQKIADELGYNQTNISRVLLMKYKYVVNLLERI